MLKDLAYVLLVVVVFMATIVRSASSGDCSAPDLLDSLPADQAAALPGIDLGSWYRASLGWIIAPDECAAREVAIEMAAASRAFERYFGMAAPSGAVVDIAHAHHAPALKKAGADWVLPWRFGAGDAASSPRADAIRTQVRAQLAAGGKETDPARVEALVEQALAQLGDKDGPKAAALEGTAIRHEIAHLLFLSKIWPSSPGNSQQYGGDAPDWLDEAAAVVAESDDMTNNRRRHFRKLTQAGGVIPLDEYLVMTHPVFAGGDFQTLIDQAREQAAAGGAAIVAASLPGEQLERARAFYAQTRVFADYLLARSGNERVLLDIARSMRGGMTFQHWLATSSQAAGLPGNLHALELDFTAWAGASD